MLEQQSLSRHPESLTGSSSYPTFWHPSTANSCPNLTPSGAHVHIDETTDRQTVRRRGALVCLLEHNARVPSGVENVLATSELGTKTTFAGWLARRCGRQQQTRGRAYTTCIIYDRRTSTTTAYCRLPRRTAPSSRDPRRVTSIYQLQPDYSQCHQITHTGALLHMVGSTCVVFNRPPRWLVVVMWSSSIDLMPQ